MGLYELLIHNSELPTVDGSQHTPFFREKYQKALSQKVFSLLKKVTLKKQNQHQLIIWYMVYLEYFPNPNPLHFAVRQPFLIGKLLLHYITSNIGLSTPNSIGEIKSFYLTERAAALM